MWLFALLGLVVVVVIALLVVGRETARLAGSARPAVFDLAEATEFIADRLPPAVQARISHHDVEWILLADADLLEEATADPEDRRYPWSRRPRLVGGRPIPARDDAGAVIEDGGEGPGGPYAQVVDEDVALARILVAADAAGREVADEDIVAVLDGRLAYLEAIGAIGGEAGQAP
ncbi:MAG: hypothetical protein JWM47_3485 [Acidimicrobiales bacterium]|nr:hypothetical protein [Acidimicrobiales bacterium]